MKNSSKNKIIDRVMSFLKNETPISKSRMTSAFIEELKLVKKAPLNDDDTKRQNLLDFAYHVNLCEGDVEEIDWIELLEMSVDDEHEYIYHAYRDMPSTIDCESVPFGKKRHYWLDAVYDGFDALCEHLKDLESKK